MHDAHARPTVALALRGRQRWLLVYDNAEDPRALAEYLPGGGGHVLITSRNPDCHELATPVAVEVFDRAESISLLRQRVTGLSDGDAGRIAAALEDLPLAVNQAAAFLAETGCAVQQYLELLASRAAEVLAQGAPVTYPASLAAGWQLAFDRLAVDEPAALDLLNLAAQLAPEPIPFTLFTGHADVSWLLDRAGSYLYSRGEPRPARQLFERAFELRLRLLG